MFNSEMGYFKVVIHILAGITVVYPKSKHR